MTVNSSAEHRAFQINIQVLAVQTESLYYCTELSARYSIWHPPTHPHASPFQQPTSVGDFTEKRILRFFSHLTVYPPPSALPSYPSTIASALSFSKTTVASFMLCIPLPHMSVNPFHPSARAPSTMPASLPLRTCCYCILAPKTLVQAFHKIPSLLALWSGGKCYAPFSPSS